MLKAEDTFPRPRLDRCLVRIERRRVATRDLEPRVRDEKTFWSVVLHLHTDDYSLTTLLCHPRFLGPERIIGLG